MNIIDQFTNAWKVFCRPPRQTYSVFDLGAPLFQTKNYKCKRQEFKVKNNRGHTLECSFYEPVGMQNPECIIYLHCFNGSRIESVKFAEPSISRGCAFCCFDFSGSGMSEGEYVSLGYYEQEDVSAVITYLRSQLNVKSIALWGRSMGAVTALLYTQKFPNEVQALAIDSAFVSMWDAGLEIADKKVSLPTFIIKGMLEYVRRQIKQNAGYDMDDVNTIKEIQKCLMPVLFIVSKEDKLVSSENSQKLYDKYPAHAKKNILFVKGDHNECRDWEDVLKIADFLAGTIRKEVKSDTPQNKENNHLIQVDQSNYNTPNPRDDQRQQNAIKMIQYQQQQLQHKNGSSSPQVNTLANQRSPNGSVSNESPANQLYKMPASHNHSYHSSQTTGQNQTVTHTYILHNQQNSVPSSHHSQHQSLSKPTPQISPQTLHPSQKDQQNATKKPLHQYSTSNITADHYKQFGQAGIDDKNHPMIDPKEMENNPLVQSLLKDLIQKNYTNEYKPPSEINQQQQFQNPSFGQSPQVNQGNEPNKNLNFTTKMNEFEYKQQVVLNKGIQSLQNQLQVQNSPHQANQMNNSPILLSQMNNPQINKNQSLFQQQNAMQNNNLNIPLQDAQQLAGSRKSSVVSPTNQDLKASNIPDEMHEIDFPKAKDFRTKQRITNYTFQMHPPGGTFQNQMMGMNEYGMSSQQNTPLNDAQRKTSLIPENNYINSIPPTQQSQISITKLQEQYSTKNNPASSAFTTVNNSPQFFADKSSSSPNSIQPQIANKNLSQVLIEESINVPQSNNYPYPSNILTNQQQIPGQPQQQQSQQQQQQQFQQMPQQPQHHRQPSLQKANVLSTQEEEDYHHLPQSTLTINLKQYF